MIQGHSFRALLSPSIKSSSWFSVHEFIHGVTAPLFLFIAGFVFLIATKRRWEDFLKIGRPLGRRIWRYFSLVMIGYWLHLPYFSFYRTITDNQGLLSLCKVDILHCIGVSLFIQQIMILLFKREKLVSLLSLILGLAFLLLAPILWGIKIIELPFLIAYLNPQYSSLFPLFPWAGYLFLGTATSALFLYSQKFNREGIFMRGVLIIGIGLTAGGILFNELIHIEFIPSPVSLFINLGMVLSVLGGFWFLENFKILKKTAFLGQESLMMYVGHLIVLFGSVLNKGIVDYYHSLSLFQTIIIFLLLLGAMVGIAYPWHWLKTHRIVWLKTLQATGVILFLILFFIKRY